MSNMLGRWMLDPEMAARFATEWRDSWNAHDLDRVLSHYHEDVVFRSPVASRVIPGSDGVMRGKSSLRRYWSEALARIPDLHFDVTSIFAGIDTLVIQYRNQKNVDVVEVLIFDGPLIVSGMGTYPHAVLNLAGLSAGS